MTQAEAYALMAGETPVWMRREIWPQPPQEPYNGMGCFLWIKSDVPGNSPQWQDRQAYYPTDEDQLATDWTPVTNFETGAIIPPPKFFLDPPFFRLRPDP